MKKTTNHQRFRGMFSSRVYLSILHLLAGFGLCGLLFLTSCSPIQRHQKLVEKYPFVHTSDTIVLRDTIRTIVPKVRVDSVFSFTQFRDTIRIERERLKITMYPVHDSIYIQGECDTIQIEKIVERRIPIKYYETESSFMKWIVLAMIALFTLYAILRKREN